MPREIWVTNPYKEMGAPENFGYGTYYFGVDGLQGIKYHHENVVQEQVKRINQLQKRVSELEEEILERIGPM